MNQILTLYAFLITPTKGDVRTLGLDSFSRTSQVYSGHHPLPLLHHDKLYIQGLEAKDRTFISLNAKA